MAALPTSPKLELLSWAREPPTELQRHAEQALYLARTHLVEQLDQSIGMELPVLLVKGAALALTTYAVPWERAMSDVDLLVDSSRFVALIRLLKRQGYEEVEPQLREHSRSLLEAVLLPPAPMPSIPVEVHASLDKVAPRRWPFYRLWERGESVGNGLLRIPSLEDHVLLVAIHLASDEFAHAWGLVDLEALIRKGADLKVVAERARMCGASTALRLALMALKHRLPAILSESDLPQGVASVARARLLNKLFDPTTWPVSKTKPSLGWAWIAKQAALRDDPLHFLEGVGAYALARALDRAPSRPAYAGKR